MKSLALGYTAGEAANRRGDARVLLLSLAFMTTGGFLGLHAVGTPGVLFTNDLSGFQVAIPVGLLVSAVFAAGSAFVDVRPGLAPLVMRRRRLLRVAVVAAMASWFVWTVAKVPPLHNPNSEAATGSLLAVLAIVGTLVYAEVAAVLEAYWGIAAPLITCQFGGELEKFIGDGMLATFNSRDDQPDHALRAARAGLALQQEVARLRERHPEWPGMRIGVNTGEAVVREIGGEGHVAYPLVGDTVNTGSRLESLAPAGGVLVGSETYERLPDGVVVEPKTGLRIKGKEDEIDAFLLLAVPG
jgi:Adenylate and Guanylate cyclase catalytic domain